ncbi:MAG: hypothetical protein CMJ81_18085 [Planctomycetaceae bacterium]|nr:hypothetical protein [Planctomycetaceae bacterium]MBP63442.1 hypothetical protein [Planctomycetaceae bacterium]
MAEKPTIIVELDETHHTVKLQIFFPADSIGHNATLGLHQHVRVKDKDPVHAKKELHRHDFRIKHARTTFTIAASSFSGFSYNGSKIEIEYLLTLEIDDGIFFDTKVSEEIVYNIAKKPKVNRSTKALIEPKDRFNFFTNLQAIPPRNRLLTMLLLVAAVVVIAVNSIIGWHDQTVPRSQTYFYSQIDSDGDSSSPLLKSLGNSGAVGVAIWLAMRRQLQKYMTFHFKPHLGRIDRTTSMPIGQLISGVARVELNEPTLRVVACNLEKGQYMRGSGSDRRKVSFSEPVQGVLLYEKTVKTIPRNQPVQNHFAGNVEFAPMFDALYPPVIVSKSHGLDVHWEVQLLVDKLVDQELTGKTGALRKEDFYSDGS